MKKYILLLASIAMLVACSSPKYTYNFDYYDYNSGKKKKMAQEVSVVEIPEVKSLVTVDEGTLVASARETEVYIAKHAPVISKEEAVARINSMSKEEKRELKREVKKIVKEGKKENTVKGNATKALENDVKLAAIFGTVGIVLLIIGGDVLYVLGAIGLLVGLYFFIRWLIHQ
jgi:preprotein translocase subunit SecF